MRRRGVSRVLGETGDAVAARRRCGGVWRKVVRHRGQRGGKLVGVEPADGGGEVTQRVGQIDRADMVRSSGIGPF